CVSQNRENAFKNKVCDLNISRETLHRNTVTPNEAARFNIHINRDGIRRSAYELLSYNDISRYDLEKIWPELGNIPTDILEQLEIESGYSGYLTRQQMDIDSFKREEGLTIPSHVSYENFPSLSSELRLKLSKNRPHTIGAACKIQGITPAAINALIAFIKKQDNDTHAA
ncbi:MAG: tRNA uridine-5-carboxymethylaminomethyl(34) synthesis enzyme MnmG, partial [Alphaproteobacteria bacterium]